tara:strand:+ start:25 stop:447 length:423 start_codon:yes stop_codon:yes gene_type:complete
MLIKEFISETNKNQMISTLFKYYKVQNIKVKHKVMKRHANYEVEDGILYLSTRYKTIKKSQIKEFLITIIHEIDHAMMAKKHGWRKFRDMWEFEANKIEQGFVKGATDAYWDNPYEIQAEKFGQKNWKKWYNTFKKQGLL